MTRWKHVAGVMDTNADGNPVYTKYNRNYPDSDVYTLWNKSGKGTTAHSNSGGRIWDMQACTSYPYEPDNCSDWWTDNHAHGWSRRGPNVTTVGACRTGVPPPGCSRRSTVRTLRPSCLVVGQLRERGGWDGAS